uniref:uncharacterized protein LOC122785910 isoform X2 n=1 Tax=Solea senegalensis TaxID=28829 RepID=UPI001CD832AC|nr:uncharacterized protein LOC122785910 isoform X2 [Solea senegalensis]
MKVHQRRPPLSRRTSSASNDKNFLDFSTTTASAQTLGSLQGALQGQIPEPAVAEARRQQQHRHLVHCRGRCRARSRSLRLLKHWNFQVRYQVSSGLRGPRDRDLTDSTGEQGHFEALKTCWLSQHRGRWCSLGAPSQLSSAWREETSRRRSSTHYVLKMLLHTQQDQTQTFIKTFVDQLWTVFLQNTELMIFHRSFWLVLGDDMLEVFQDNYH